MNNNEMQDKDLNIEEQVEVNTSSKKKKNNVFSIILIIIGVLCIGIALYGLFDIYMEYKEGDDIYKEAEDEFVQIQDVENDTEIAGTEVVIPWYERATVDVAGLKKQYPELIGWLFFEDGLISYPVMQADDNDKYLHITYNGKTSKMGSIFMDATHRSDFSNTHTILYGHNMNNLSMFGRLKHYKTQEGYYEGHEYFQIFCGDEIWRYQIFSYQDISVESFVYYEHFTSASELANRLLKTSYINPGLEIQEDDKIITLSTCTYDKQHRFVVNAVLIEKYSLTEKAIIEN